MGKISADKIALVALEGALKKVLDVAGQNATPAMARRIRVALAQHAVALEAARALADPIRLPATTFDPADPKIVGRVVSIALMAQPCIPIVDVKPAYGSGVYAIYYFGNHPFYRAISGTETPIYIGKADPSADDASNPREQGAKLTGRILEHGGIIALAESYAAKKKLPAGLYPIRLKDFRCRKLVCATNAQLVAEKHLIRMFWPIWNQETKACWGLSKHGDAAKTRKNKRSPWHVIHPGKPDFLDKRLKNSLTSDEILARIKATLAKVPPRKDHAALVEEMLAAFRQDLGTPEDERLNPPVGMEATGPNEDEGGES